MSNDEIRKRILQAEEDAKAQWKSAMEEARVYRDDHPFEVKLPPRMQRRLGRAQRNYHRACGG